MPDQLERRFLPAAAGEIQIQTRTDEPAEAQDDAEDGAEDTTEPQRTISTIIHHAPPWNVLSVALWSEWVGGDRFPVHERFERGAFAEVLATPDLDVVGLRDHRRTHLLGRTPGTLRLAEDDLGLRYEIDVPDTQVGREIVTLIDRGDVRGSSFAFRVDDEDGEHWSFADADGNPVENSDEATMIVRTVTKVSGLFDTGPVTFPAYLDAPTDVAVRGEEIGFRSVGDPEEARRGCQAWLEGMVGPPAGAREAAKARLELRCRLMEMA